MFCYDTDMQGLCFLNGSWISLDQATISITDLAVIRGYGAFDYLRTYRGLPFHLEDHLIRLKKSADTLGLSLPYSFEEIEEMINEGLEKTSYPETAIKLLLTGGVSEDQFNLAKSPTFCMMVYPLKLTPLKQYQKGIQVITTRNCRPMPQVKSTCYLPALAAFQKAQELGADDALYINQNDEILEGLTSNIFVVQKSRLITPHSEEILVGITREIVKRCAASDIPFEHAKLPVSDLPNWDEAFLTSSNREIMPIVAIDGTPIGDGTVGPMTKEIQRRFKAYTQEPGWLPLWTSLSVNNKFN